jgi:hypothetical protein
VARAASVEFVDKPGLRIWPRLFFGESRATMYKFAVVATTWVVVMYWFLNTYTNVLA